MNKVNRKQALKRMAATAGLLALPTQKTLIQSFRAHKLPVVFTKFISHPHYYLLWEWSPQCQPPTKCCWKGHQRYYKDVGASRDCMEIIDELLPAPGDIIIEKFGHGAFYETLLNKSGIYF
jgi:nicotinamidase-related amidase